MGAAACTLLSTCSKPAVRVAVCEAGVEDGHGVYALRLTEEATTWTVRRRWRELKALDARLKAEYGKGSVLGLELPTLPRAFQTC